MDDNEYRKASLEIEKKRLELEREKFSLENTFIKRHFGALVTALVTFSIGVLSYVQVTTSKESIDATIHSARITRDAELVKTSQFNEIKDHKTNNTISIINPAGTLYRFEETSECKKKPATPILSNNTLLLGLQSTDYKTNSAQIMVFGYGFISVKVGGTGVIAQPDRIFNISISHISECSADYRIWEINQSHNK